MTCESEMKGDNRLASLRGDRETGRRAYGDLIGDGVNRDGAVWTKGDEGGSRDWEV